MLDPSLAPVPKGRDVTAANVPRVFFPARDTRSSRTLAYPPSPGVASTAGGRDSPMELFSLRSHAILRTYKQIGIPDVVARTREPLPSACSQVISDFLRTTLTKSPGNLWRVGVKPLQFFSNKRSFEVSAWMGTNLSPIGDQRCWKI